METRNLKPAYKYVVKHYFYDMSFHFEDLQSATTHARKHSEGCLPGQHGLSIYKILPTGKLKQVNILL